jgi:hypothetical protein
MDYRLEGKKIKGYSKTKRGAQVTTTGTMPPITEEK